MAVSILPAPGTEYGPCESECQHRDCAQTRQMATEVCRFCDKPIGFGVSFYDDPEKPDSNVSGLVHAICLEKAIETAFRKKAIENATRRF